MSAENQNNVLPYIVSLQDSLNKKQKIIADYIIHNPSAVIIQTSKEISEALGISEASIVRFCQRIGFNGYRDFRLKLARDQGNEISSSVAPEGINENDSFIETAKKVMQIEHEDILFTANMLDEGNFTQIVELIASCRHLAFFGVGSSSIVASTAKEHFLHYGKACYAEIESLEQICLANTLGKGDVAFAISISGSSQIPIQAIEIATKRGATTVCLTQNFKSPLAKICQYILPVYRKNNTLDDLGTASRIVHLSLIDALAIAYASRDWAYAKKITTENRKNFHKYLYAK